MLLYEVSDFVLPMFFRAFGPANVQERRFEVIRNYYKEDGSKRA